MLKQRYKFDAETLEIGESKILVDKLTGGQAIRNIASRANKQYADCLFRVKKISTNEFKITRCE